MYTSWLFFETVHMFKMKGEVFGNFIFLKLNVWNIGPGYFATFQEV